MRKPAPKADASAGPELGPSARSWSWVLVSALVVIGILLPTLWFPYGRDQAVFGYVGQVLARGGMPYRDAWDLKPPGIYLAYGLLAWLTRGDGASLMLLLRIADLAIAAACGVLIAALARRAGRPEAAVAAAAWYAGLYLQGGYWSLAQAEAWANPLVLAAGLLCLLETGGRKGLRLLGAAGLLAGGVALLKFTSLLALAPFLALAILRQKARWRLPAAMLLGVAAALPVLGAAAWLASRGALEDYVDIQRGFVAPYTRISAGSPGVQLAHGAYRSLLWLGQTWLPVLLAAAVAFRSSLPGALRPRLLLTALGCALATVWLQGKYFGYHWQTVLPLLAVLAAAGVPRLLAHVRLDRRWIPAAGLLAAVIWSGAANWGVYRDAVGAASGTAGRDRWLARFGRPYAGDNSFAATRWAADYVREHTAPGDPVLVWGFEPAVYLLSDRWPDTRFFFNVPVAAPFVPGTWREEFKRDLEQRPPTLMLVLRHDAIPWANGRTDDSAAQLADWPWLADWLEQGYTVETEIEDFTIYRRRPGPGAKQ